MPNIESSLRMFLFYLRLNKTPKSLHIDSERELARLNKVLKALAPVVQTLDSAIHRINHYPADSVIDFRNTYPLDRSAARVLTSYMTTGIRSFLPL